MNKPVHLGLSILELSKILMYEFCKDYVKPKCGKKVKLCYTLMMLQKKRQKNIIQVS